MKDVLCIMGPTAAGKSWLAMQVANQIPAEIISVDSALVYRGMDLGTAKPSKADQAKVTHHLIDLINPDEVFSVANFCVQANLLITDIKKRNHLPILVGGTMMYFHALQHGLTQLPVVAPVVRQELLRRVQQDGLQSLYAELLRCDIVSASKISANDSQRIIRALEVFLSTGKSLSQWHKAYHEQHSTQANNCWYNICIMPVNRVALHQQINQRFLAMLATGLVEEVESLYKIWQLTRQHASMRIVGYRQVLSYILGEFDYDIMVSKAVAATRQLAKRQLTWCRSWPKIDCMLDLLDNNDASYKAIVNLLMRRQER